MLATVVFFGGGGGRCFKDTTHLPWSPMVHLDNLCSLHYLESDCWKEHAITNDRACLLSSLHRKTGFNCFPFCHPWTYWTSSFPKWRAAVRHERPRLEGRGCFFTPSLHWQGTRPEALADGRSRNTPSPNFHPASWNLWGLGIHGLHPVR